jgi:hypothetical protein
MNPTHILDPRLGYHPLLLYIFEQSKFGLESKPSPTFKKSMKCDHWDHPHHSKQTRPNSIKNRDNARLVASCNAAFEPRFQALWGLQVLKLLYMAYFSTLIANLVNVATHHASCPVATIHNATVNYDDTVLNHHYCHLPQ